MLSGEIKPILNAKKNGIANRKFNSDTYNENSNAESVKSTFF